MTSKAAGLGRRGERIRIQAIQLQSWPLWKSNVFLEYSEGRGHLLVTLPATSFPGASCCGLERSWLLL